MDKAVQRLVVTADGSCLGNPGPGGWAWALSDDCWAAGGHPRTTNNLMELRAVYEALHALPTDIALTVQTDSKYVIGIFTEWLPRWETAGWRTSAKKDVANQKAIKQVQALLAARDVEWMHVRGHAGHAMNEWVDSCARAAAEAIQSGRDAPRGDLSRLRGVVTQWRRDNGSA